MKLYNIPVHGGYTIAEAVFSEKTYYILIKKDGSQIKESKVNSSIKNLILGYLSGAEKIDRIRYKVSNFKKIMCFKDIKTFIKEYPEFLL